MRLHTVLAVDHTTDPDVLTFADEETARTVAVGIARAIDRGRHLIREVPPPDPAVLWRVAIGADGDFVQLSQVVVADPVWCPPLPASARVAAPMRRWRPWAVLGRKAVSR